MKLEPQRYVCPDHAVDLTDQVEDALYDKDDNFSPLIYGDRRPGSSPFEVPVTCPGAGGTGKHSVTCSGTLTR